MNRKLLQFKYRNWWNCKDTGSHQLAILPTFDIWWNRDYIDNDGNPRDDETVICFVFAWLGWCFEFWVNSSDELV